MSQRSQTLLKVKKCMNCTLFCFLFDKTKQINTVPVFFSEQNHNLELVMSDLFYNFADCNVSKIAECSLKLSFVPADWSQTHLAPLSLHVSLTLFESHLLCILTCLLYQIILSHPSFIFSPISPLFHWLSCATVLVCVGVCRMLWVWCRPEGIKSSCVGGLAVSTEPWSDGSGLLGDLASGAQQDRQPRHVWTLVLFN